jgi:DNA-binding LytR/AlgR family response regulator
MSTSIASRPNNLKLPFATSKSVAKTTRPSAHPDPIGTYIFIRHEGRNIKIELSDIRYIEARKNYCKIATKDASYLIIVTLKRMVELLPAAAFCQIHRAFIVSLDWIKAFDTGNVYDAEQTVPIGPDYRQSLYGRVQVIGMDRRKFPFKED